MCIVSVFNLIIEIFFIMDNKIIIILHKSNYFKFEQSWKSDHWGTKVSAKQQNKTVNPTNFLIAPALRFSQD